MPVRFRLTAPIFPKHGGRQLAQGSLQNFASSGRHRDAVPIFNCGEAKWEGNGLISRLRAGSIPAPATNPPAGLFENGDFVRRPGSIDSLSPESSPLRAS